jgi:hypothetical protein
MDGYGRPLTPLITTLHGDLYIAIIVVRYVGRLTAFTIALHRFLYIAYIMDRYAGPLTALIIELKIGI